MNPYNPDKFQLTKAELTNIMDLICQRWQRNPKVNRNVVRCFQLQLAFFKSRFVKEQDLPYAWMLFCELFDNIRSLNDRKNHPELEKINPIMEQAFKEEIALFPEEKEKHKNKVIVDFTNGLRFGAMRENEEEE
jgi:hypothetical protein